MRKEEGYSESNSTRVFPQRHTRKEGDAAECRTLEKASHGEEEMEARVSMGEKPELGEEERKTRFPMIRNALRAMVRANF